MLKKKTYLGLIIILCIFIATFTGCSLKNNNNNNNNGGNNTPPNVGTRIQLVFNNQKVYGTLDDNSVSRDLISRLPLTLDFSDYNGTEKIAYLPSGAASWDTSDAPSSCTPQEGDITMYAPWGNLAIFYHSFRQSNGLVPLGKLDEGEINKIAEINDDFTVTISLAEEETTQSLEFTLEDNAYTVTGVGDETNIIIPAIYEGLPVTKIQGLHGNGAFTRKNIISITIPDSITEIGQNTFYGCSNLKEIKITENSNLTKIGNNAFSGAISLESIYIPKKVTSIGTSAFNNCGGLNTITVSKDNEVYSSEGNNLIEKTTQTLIRGSNSSIIPGTIKTIGVAAFRKSSVEQILIPESVEIIENYAFEDCLNLTQINVESTNNTFASLNGVLYNKTFTELLVVPNGITGNLTLSSTLKEIPMFAFEERDKLESVTIIENSIEYIDNFAFRNVTFKIRYTGSKSQWEAIEKASEWGGELLTISFDINDGTEEPLKNNILVAYFSYSGTTKGIAEKIAQMANATLVEIIPVNPYTSEDVNYNNSLSRSQQERLNDARPEISNETYAKIQLSDYSVVILGYPIWNGYEPMIIRTFIEHYSGFAGKTLYAFSTSASSSGQNAFNSIKKYCQLADVKDYLHFTSYTISTATSVINTKLIEWKLINENESLKNSKKQLIKDLK